MKLDNIEHAQTHVLLASIGKKVLRPGGKELTKQLIEALSITPDSTVVEFAPGSGFTAEIVQHKRPAKYFGIDSMEFHVDALKNKFHDPTMEFVLGDAEATGLNSESVDKVFGEAMLSMHANQRKTRIIKEASRILKKGGIYAIHELELNISALEENRKEEIQRELALVSNVNARPQTIVEWSNLLEEEGLKVIDVKRRPLRVLEPSRILDDEGFLQTLKIAFNVLRSPKTRKRVFEMRKTFKKYDEFLNGVVIVAEKV